MDLKKRLISIVVLFFVVAISWIVFTTNNRKPIIYRNFGTNIPQTYSVLGIDISHHQGAINWSAAADMSVDGDSIQFVYIKATEGLSFIDKKMKTNTEGARIEGLRYGLYHYYLPTLSAKKQADFFIQNIRYSNYTLAPALDVEVSGDLKNRELADSIKVFLDCVESVLKMRPIIYTYESFYLDYLENTKVSSEKYWVASYKRNSELIRRENFLIWQFSESGTINGIKESVDLNIAKENLFGEIEKKEE